MQSSEAQLRNMAEVRLAAAPPAEVVAHSAEKLLHELQVHKIELEMQNETLRQSQVALEESRDLDAKRYADLYEFAPVGYITLSNFGQIIEANLTIATLLGVERKKMLNRRFDSFVAAEDREHYQTHTRHDLADGAELEFRFVRPDGETRWIGHYCHPIFGDDGTLLGRRGSNRDITERKAAESELRRRNEELARFNRAMIGRELDMLALKQQINALSTELGRERPFPLAFLNADVERRGK